MVGLNNVRVALVEEWSREHEGAHEFKRAATFLDALFDLFCCLAAETQEPQRWVLEHPRDSFFPADSANKN